MRQAVKKSASAQATRFIGAWVRSPFAVGAVMPSSRWLSRAMAGQVNVKKPGMVIELGAGTGVVTHALLQTGLEPERLVVVERDPRLHATLALHFHHLNVLCADAVYLSDVIAGLSSTRINAIVSSLPLLSMPKQVRLAIERAMAQAIGKGGRIVQFTYGPKSPISKETLKKYHLTGKRVKMVIANVPPAHVWVYHPVNPPLASIFTKNS